MDIKQTIKEQVSIYQILSYYGWDYMGGGHPEQINCLMHRPDVNRSARVYPDSNSIYCWVCDKAWDPIELVKDMEELTFAHACSTIVKRFNVQVQLEDYEARLYAAMHNKVSKATIEEFAETVERMFTQFTNNILTSEQFNVNIDVVNECWASKDHIMRMKSVDTDQLKQWLTTSQLRIRRAINHEEGSNTKT